MDRVAFWILMPFLAVFVVGMLWVDIFTSTISTLGGRFLLAGICIIVGALGLAFYDLNRFWWAGQIVAASVLLLYAAYVIDEWFFTGHKWSFASGFRSAASPINSLLGLFAYGVPAFWYLFSGKFRRRGDEPHKETEHDEEDGDMDDKEHRVH